MNIDGMPAPEIACPQCGATTWLHFDLPDNTCLQHQLLRNGERLINASFVLFIAVIVLLNVPSLQDLELVAFGILLCLPPSSWLMFRLTGNIKSRLYLCETCDFARSE
ncbi:hypothetical protein [Massilia aquatica]|uniref:DUF983 domain-containing protein n=1 Tax=Massilia aquatica TaxID=2609000 RepID=A0ABX0MCI5_9BURK|nr:hypothetical protein [Massilia aquatica]NHZ44878.1 hypothetical protein [Massilia aquatica]